MALRKCFTCVLLVVIGGMACSSPDADRPKLLDSTANEAQSQETERLRRMQLVKVIDTSKDPEEVVELSSSQIFDGLTQCGLSFQYGRDICRMGGDSCDQLTCLIAIDMCVGEHMLAVADGTGSAVTYKLYVPGLGPTQFEARIPPQSAASSAALAIDATKAFERAMAGATSALNAGCDALQEPTISTGGASVQAFATTAFMDAFEQGKRAYHTAFKHTLAVSDAELSSSSQLEVARVRAISKESLSRTAAAHLMVGGQAGWFGSTNEAFCTGSKLTGPENAALAILREAALNPNDVACGVSPPYDCGPSTDALVNGTLTGLQPQSGSVRARLAEAWGANAIPANVKVWDAYGLTEADFVAAHRALAQEIKIFGRSDSAKLTPRALPGGVAPVFDRFAGATGKAPDRPDQYWALLALLDAPENAVQHGSWRPQDDDREMFLDSFADPLTGADNLADFIDRAYSWARLIEGANLPTSPDPTAAKREVQDPLRLLLGGEDIRGRLMHCRQHAGDIYVGTQQIRVAGYEAADSLALVLGQNLMDCAVNGHIEGAPCVLPDILNAPGPNDPEFTGEIIRLTEESYFNKGPFKTQVQANFDSILGVSGRYYLIRPRQKGDPQPGPGQWELILGTPLFKDSSWVAGQFCRDVPIVPEAIERAAHAIAPSRDWCGSSEVSCSEDIRFDERLPLEDELSTDHDDLESSWRHYLELARRAVDHADALGEEYIQAALQDDFRDEETQLRRFQQEEKAVGEFQRIQEICGASANPNAILDFLGTDVNGDLDLSQASDTECDSNADGPPICGLRKLASSNPEMGAIAACLGTFGKLTETHLGDGGLCVKNRDATLLETEPPVRVVASCQDDSSTPASDEIGPDTGCDDPGSPSMPRYHCVPVSRGLALFNTASLLPDPPLPALCDGIRKLRSQPVEGDAERKRLYDAIVSEHIFSADTLASLGGSTSMKVDYQTFGGVGPLVKLQVGPDMLLSTGVTTGLCGTSNTACPSGSDGLFCRTWNCADPASRAELNLRLYKAGVALLNALPGAEARLDTLWYLNFYLQADKGWGEGAQSGQWRIFNFEGTRIPQYSGAAITVPQGTQTGFAMGTQQFSVQGPLPRATDDPASNVISHPNNKAMMLAFRNAFMAVGSRGAGLKFDMLDKRPASLAEPAGSVVIYPGAYANGERDFGLGAMVGCYSQPGTPSDACEVNYTATSFGNGDLVQTNLWNAQLRFFSSTGALESSEVAPASQRGFARTATVFGKQLFPAPSAGLATSQVGLDVQARLDALELACEALEGNKVQLSEGCGKVVSVKTVRDFDAVGNQLECLGNDIIHRAATAVYQLPAPAIQYLKNGERVFDATGGSLAVAISDLRQSLLEAATSGPIVGGTLRRFGEDLRGLRAQLERIQIEKKIEGIQLQASIANQITSCLTSTASAFTLENWGGGAAAAIVTCANSIAQIGFATQISDLQSDALTLQSDEALAAFSGRATDYVQTLESQSLRLSQALEGIQRNLEIIEGLKAEAQRALQSATWMLSKQASNQVSISNALDNISVGKGIRYRRALEAGQKMAFLAKRAIEMRLGMPLADMVHDLPLVTAPATWEATVCQTTGIDYQALRDRTEQGDTTKQAESFADSFLGDYVTKLEQVVESYRLVNNFHEGKDTVVVSLRDDIHNTRAACEVASPNLLYGASKFEPQFAPTGQSANGWTLSGCTMESAETEAGVIEQPTGDCIVARARQDAPFFNPLLGQPIVPGYDIEFGLPDWCGAQCAYQSGAALSQQILLEPGRYRFSWYTTDGAGAGGTKAAQVRHADGTPFTVAKDRDGDDAAGFTAGINGEWNRVWMSFDVFDAETVTIGFERPSATDFTVPLAAPMLEKLEDPFHVSTLPTPPRFMDTTDERTAFLPVCEDRTGRNFRAQKWDHNCVKLCPDGYASDCAEKARTECFWETSFHISQRSIEAGHIFNQSGFARGNFNYRIRSIGVNFVGTELRSCADSGLPSTCHSAGYIPYTVIHDGPYYVRNHKGQDYRAALFPGRIEHARGLGIERYITNPMGDSDRSLMEGYMRAELSGRPLDGEFILRVWDEPGVNFNAIEDVQLIIDYGYWTRFN
jgi:hypothetical protein